MTNISHIEKLKLEIAPLRNQLIHHPVFNELRSLTDLNTFTEHHVFAVWDFMSLLKSLQRDLTCIEVPWIPIGNATTRYLINEIVTGEESDVDANGQRFSHFELYLRAMLQAGSDTSKIDLFIENMKSGSSVLEGLKASAIDSSIEQFVMQTFQIIELRKTHVTAAVFTFGREDLIPDMFLSLINRLKVQFPNKVDILHYYIERHIEVA